MPRKRKLPDGLWERNGVYYARFRAGGRLIRKRLSTNLDAAKELLNELKARADKADFGLLDNDYSLADLKTKWLRHCEQTLRPSTVRRYREQIEHVLGALPCNRVCEVTTDVIVTYRADRLKTPLKSKKGNEKPVTPRTVNMAVVVLSTMLSWGVEHKYIGSNPIAGVKPLPSDRKAKNRRALRLEEVQRLFDASPEYLRPAWRMFMTTGIRHDELVEMTFSDVDFERGAATVHAFTAKNHRAREIPLDDETLAMIMDLREKARHRQPVAGHTAKQTEQQLANFSREHIFVTKANTPFRNNLLTRFYAVCKKAKIEDAVPGGSVDIHSLRVSFITLAVEGGANPKAIQEIVGHSTLHLTMSVYAKATDRAKRDAVSSLPFAKVSPPKHLIPVQNEHAARTSQEKSPEDHARQRVRIVS